MRESIKQKGLPLYQQVGIPTAGAGAASQMLEPEEEAGLAGGGSVAKLAALAKLKKMREEMAPRAEAVKSLIARDENSYLRDVVPNSLTNAEIESEIKRIAARARASGQQEGVLPRAERDANLAKFLQGNYSEVPKIVKHATRTDFPAFDINKSSPSNRLGPGFYTANDMGTTSSYSSGEGGNIMPLHISLKNPIVGSELTPEQIQNFYSQIKTKKFSNGFDATEAQKDIMERALENPTRAFSTLLSGVHYFDTNDWINGMKATGHDGIIGNRNGKPEYVVFDNKQLKSATGNRGTYDINEPEVNKAKGGEVRMTKNRDTMFMELSNKKLKRK